MRNTSKSVDCRRLAARKTLLPASSISPDSGTSRLAVCRRSFECWRMVFVFAGGSLTSALVSFGFPAMGSFVHATEATISAMPQGAGTYAFGDVAQFRSINHAILDMDALAGVITFPSVHTILALLAIQAWWWHPILRWPVLALNLLVIVTTIPMGGHYYIDLLAGALVWMVWSKVAQWVAKASISVKPIAAPLTTA